MAISKHKNKISLGILIGGLVLTLGFIISNGVFAIPDPCQNSETCREAKKKEKEAKDNAASAASTATAYQAKVSELTSEIADTETEISNTEVKIKVLKKQITKTEEELIEKQEALAGLLVNMHFESDAEPIRILAGATSISDLAEKAAREETAKGQISAAATEVKNTKEQLESDKIEVESLLNRQQESRKNLIAKKSEQQSLVEKYQNDAESYNEIAKAEQQKQRDAIKKEMESNPTLYNGRVSTYTGANTYPWQGDCPGRQDAYGTIVNGNYIGGLVCECVSYTGWKAYEAYGLVLAWGNAYSWDDRARSAGYVVNRTPAAGTIGQLDNGPYGHVFWVESVNADGSIDVTEYNNPYATQLYNGNYRFGDFGARTIPAGSVGNYNYIHLR